MLLVATFAIYDMMIVASLPTYSKGKPTQSRLFKRQANSIVELFQETNSPERIGSLQIQEQ